MNSNKVNAEASLGASDLLSATFNHKCNTVVKVQIFAVNRKRGAKVVAVHVHWYLLFTVAIVLSAFLHEVGHGISAYLAGHPVSTGFNRVGDAGKRPSSEDFRKHHQHYDNPSDAGPIVTLTVAVLLTAALLMKPLTVAGIRIIGAFALANSILRLMPMVIAFGRLLISGEYSREDEVHQGNLLAERTGCPVVKHLVPLISLTISASCTFLVVLFLHDALAASHPHLRLATISAFVTAMPLLFWLDEHLRMDWMPPGSGS